MLLIMKGKMEGRVEITGSKLGIRILANALRVARETGENTITYCESELKNFGQMSTSYYDSTFLGDMLVFEEEKDDTEVMTIAESAQYNSKKIVLTVKINKNIRPYLDYLIRVYDHELGND